MKKNYTSAQIEVLIFNEADIIVTSLPFKASGLGDSVDWVQIL